MSGDVITTFTTDELEFCNVNTLVELMEHNECRCVPGARCDETDTIFVERFFLIIGERILEDHEDLLACINDPTSAGKRLMLYKKPVSPRLVADKYVTPPQIGDQRITAPRVGGQPIADGGPRNWGLTG